MYVGSCQHYIKPEWFDDDRSSYAVLDEVNGLCVRITTCEACWEQNNEAGLIIPEDDIPVDDFVNPFANDSAPRLMKVVDSDGNTEIVDLTSFPD